MLGNLFTLFQSLLRPRWAMFCVQVPISQTRRAVLGNMEAVLSHVRGACSAKCPASVQLHFTAQMIRTRPLDSDF